MKLIYIAIFLVIAVVLAYKLLSKNPDYQENQYAKQMQIFIDSADQKARLGDVVTLDWDEVCIYLPYSIQKPDNFSIPEYEIMTSVPMSAMDETWAFLFKIKNNQRAYFVKMAVSPDRDLDKNQCFTRDSVIEKTEYTSSFNNKISQYETILIYTP